MNELRLTRRAALAAGAALAGAAALPAVPLAAQPPRGFVRRAGLAFTLDDGRHRYVGTNMWYATWLGADAPFGDRDRLRRELDRLAALGVTNVRASASAELSPLRNSVRPAFRDRAGDYNETLLAGLDFFLAELGRRDMRAVLYLANFWEWSGGMATYLYWTNGGRYIDMNDPAHPWPEFPDFASGFYESAPALVLFRAYVRAVVGRMNTVAGRPYREDPAIMAWQLANEPRPGGSEAVGRRRLPAFFRWVAETARLTKAIDPNHLVSTGNEGLKGCLESGEIVAALSAIPEIDYMTIHIWPQNWDWIDPADMAGSWPRCEALVRDYVAQHIALARAAGKPLVIEEFGFPRDGVAYDPRATTVWRDRYYRLIYESALADMRAGGPTAGTHFWAWSGEGRAAHADHRFRAGDVAWLGDPPHEPQGWYGLFDSDESTQAIVRQHAGAVAALGA